MAQIMIGMIAVLHLYIMYIEMFAWETKGKKFSKEHFRPICSRRPRFWQPIKACTMAF